MNTQNSAYPSIEIDFAALDSGAEECAIASFKNYSRMANTVRLDQSSYTYPVTDYDLHGVYLSNSFLSIEKYRAVSMNLSRKRWVGWVG